MSSAVHIRSENTDDLPAIHAVVAAAFQRPDEADLVDQLREQGHALLSLIAEHNNQILGHVLFSRMWIDTPTTRMPAVALAPVAVLAGHQRKGIGGLLIQQGLELLRGRGESIVIVLGDPSYYPRFGFSPELAKPLQSPFPPEAFMAIELRQHALDGIQGHVVYPPPFGI